MPVFRVTFGADLVRPEKDRAEALKTAQAVASFIDEHVGPHGSGDPYLDKTTVLSVEERPDPPDEGDD